MQISIFLLQVSDVSFQIFDFRNACADFGSEIPGAQRIWLEEPEEFGDAMKRNVLEDEGSPGFLEEPRRAICGPTAQR